jgi:hypothetical protein
VLWLMSNSACRAHVPFFIHTKILYILLSHSCLQDSSDSFAMRTFPLICIMYWFLLIKHLMLSSITPLECLLYARDFVNMCLQCLFLSNYANYKFFGLMNNYILNISSLH